MPSDISKILIVSDMDGTFLPSSKIVSKRNAEAVQQFQNAGGSFTIATGRAIQAAQQYFDSVKVNFPMILCNGGLIYDTTDGSSLYDVFVPKNTREITKRILEDNRNLGCEVLTLNTVYVPQMNETERMHNEICRLTPVEADIDSIPDNWYKVLFADSNDNINKLTEYVSTKNFVEVDFVRSSEHYYEILPQNISKGSALEKMRALCGIEDYTIIAVGDYYNDIEMLRYADIAVCPSNAEEAVKDICDIVLEHSCDEDAICELIKYIFEKTNKDFLEV